MGDRRQESYAVRLEAAELARSRNHPEHKANSEEQRYAGDKYFMSFTKGLPHDEDTGLLIDPNDFVEYRRAIDEGFIDPFTDRVRHGAKFVGTLVGGITPAPIVPDDFRQWEAPTAGVAFELQGPDAQAVTMPPAPPLVVKDGEVNPELVLEMAEVYELAILRDQEFKDFEGNTTANTAITDSLARLNALPYVTNQTGRPRLVAPTPSGSIGFIPQNVFRGSSPGVEVGPYISQFLLIGNTDLNGGGSVADGLITYGVLEIDQRVPVAEPNKDFMTDMDTYVNVQRGLQPNQCVTSENQTYVSSDGGVATPPDRPAKRFISTPRDLATYVHFDALYEAYLNACIILLGMKTPFDPGFDHLSGGGVAAGNAATRRHAGGFALYGGPHILNLVTEVSTRALKAVRFQKFNNHIRLRPEALAARLELNRMINNSGSTFPSVPRIISQSGGAIGQFVAALTTNGPGTGTLGALNPNNYFLPMAFAEGSPMHPAYGAGHATVAGACVTILKAFFDTSAVLARTFVEDPCSPGTTRPEVRFKRYSPERPGLIDTSLTIPADEPILFRAPPLNDEIVPTEESSISNGDQVPSGGVVLVNCQDDEPEIRVNSPRNLVPDDTQNYFLTLEGELNKLAANISIGRDMAGVHYFSDYYDSLRMGEEIAIGILEEQALTYSTDPFVLSLPTFDGDVVRIGRR